MKLAKVLQYLRPGAEWVIRGDQIEWLDANQTQPTDEEIQEKIHEAEKAIAMEILREERNKKLANCDFRVLPDYPGADKAAWTVYRQALRDLPSQSDPGLDENGRLINVSFPVEPK